MKAIIRASIFEFDQFRENQYILFDHKIIETGPMAEYRRPESCTEELDAKGMLLMPSLVIGHGHIYSAYLRAFQPPLFQPLSFRDLLEQVYWKLDGGLDLESSYYSAKVTALDHIRSGVTTLVDHHASGRAIRGTLEALKRGWVDESGLRGLFCFETSDRFPIEDCIAENVDFAGRHRSETCRGMFGMHASMTLSDKTLRQVAACLGDIPVHVHVAESLEDQEECVALYGKRIVERFADLGLITPDTVFAHCVHINEREAAIMAERGVHAALNPSSNCNAGHGFADYRMLRRFRVQTMLGNDSLGTNMAADFRNFAFSQHLFGRNVWYVNLNDVLRCIRTGYEYVSRMLGVRLGRIQAGYEADMLTVDYEPYAPMTQKNAWDHVFDGVFQQFRPRNVWCAGERKLRDYAVLLDEETICKESRQIAGRLWKSLDG